MDAVAGEILLQVSVLVAQVGVHIDIENAAPVGKG